MTEVNLKSLFGLDKKVKVGPKFEPKLSVRISCGRTRNMLEFAIPVPIQGEAPEAWQQLKMQLELVLKRLGYLSQTYGLEAVLKEGTVPPEGGAEP